MGLRSPDLHPEWREKLLGEMQSTYFLDLLDFLQHEYESQTVYPPQEQIFQAFRYTSPSQTKVVILGQDPYHGAGQAHGLAFSVSESSPLPPSLRNIYKELLNDWTPGIPPTGNLQNWARQGVLLLNTVMTVRAGKAGSHSKRGWEQFTDYCIQSLDRDPTPKVFILWGNPARRKKKIIHNPAHLILESAHPSPLSAYQGFFGSKVFSRTNSFLSSQGREPIRWHE